MNEESAIRSYMELTGATEATARSVFMMVCSKENFEVGADADRPDAAFPSQWATEEWRRESQIEAEGQRGQAHPKGKFGPAFSNQRAAMNWART